MHLPDDTTLALPPHASAGASTRAMPPGLPSSRGEARPSAAAPAAGWAASASAQLLPPPARGRTLTRGGVPPPTAGVWDQPLPPPRRLLARGAGAGAGAWQEAAAGSCEAEGEAAELGTADARPFTSHSLALPVDEAEGGEYPPPSGAPGAPAGAPALGLCATALSSPSYGGFHLHAMPLHTSGGLRRGAIDGAGAGASGQLSVLLSSLDGLRYRDGAGNVWVCVETASGAAPMPALRLGGSHGAAAASHAGAGAAAGTPPICVSSPFFTQAEESS